MIKLLKNTILATAFLAVSGAYAAPILEVSSDGRLTGASGVEVGGALYHVAFKDGTCAGLFSGCDQAAAGGDQLEGVGQAHHAGQAQGRVFADAVADHGCRLHAPAHPQAGEGVFDDEQRRLDEIAAGLTLEDPTFAQRITDAGLRESHPHDIVMTTEAPNYTGFHN